MPEAKSCGLSDTIHSDTPISFLVVSHLLENCNGHGFDSRPSNKPVDLFTGLWEVPSSAHSRMQCFTLIGVWAKPNGFYPRCKFNNPSQQYQYTFPFQL